MFEISATGESVSTLCVVSERAGVGLLSRVPSAAPSSAGVVWYRRAWDIPRLRPRVRSLTIPTTTYTRPTRYCRDSKFIREG